MITAISSIYIYNNNTDTTTYNASNHKNVPGSPLYIPSLPNIRTMKLLTLYSTLHISLCNIFVEKEKYHELQLHWAVSNLY